MGSTKISTPSPPKPETAQESYQAWADIQPQLMKQQLKYDPLILEQQLGLGSRYANEVSRQQMELQKEYAPQLMEQQMEMTKKYLPELTKLEYDTEKQLYPETSALTENLAKQAREGMESDVPDWMRKEYLSNLNANLGVNVGSPISSDYVSRGLLEQKKSWRDYYRDMALSLVNRMPLKSAQASNVQTPQISRPQYGGGLNWTQNFTPQNVMGYNQGNYGSYVGAYSNMYNTNAQMAQAKANLPFKYMSGVGNLLTGWGNR